MQTDRKALYREFLQSDFWVSLSTNKKRAAGKCERCGSRRYLQCHHRFYREDWYKTEFGDLEVLCDICHQRGHGLITKQQARKLRKKKRRYQGAQAFNTPRPFRVGMYEGITPQQARAQVGK